MATLQYDLSGKLGYPQFIGASTFNYYNEQDGTVLSGFYNPIERNGYMSPLNLSSTEATFDVSPNSQIGSKLYDQKNDDFYFATVGSNQLYIGDAGLTDTTLANTANITGAQALRDMEIYEVNGAQKMFIAYQNSSNKADIAISDLPWGSGTPNLTWLTGTVSGAFTNATTGDIFFLSCENGFMYMFMENQVHKIDGTSTGGTNGTITANALLFPPNFRMIDAIDFKGFTWIAVHEYNLDTRSVNPGSTPLGTTSTGVYVWDRATTLASSNTEYYRFNGVHIIHKLWVNPQGVMTAIVTNNAGLTEIREFNGNAFEPVFTVGFDEHPLFRDAVDTFLGMTAWAAHGGNYWTYGKLKPGAPDGLYKIGNFGSTASTTGAVFLPALGATGSAPSYYVTNQVGGGGTHAFIYKYPILTGQITGSMTTTTAEIQFPIKYLPQMSTLNHIDIYMNPSGGTDNTTIGSVNIYLNGSGSSWATKVITNTMATRGYVRIEVNKPFTNAIRLSIQYPNGWTCSQIDDLATGFATITYTPTNEKG